MKKKVYFFIIVIIFLIQGLITPYSSCAQPKEMLSPLLQLNSVEFVQNINRIINRPFINPNAEISEKITQARQAYAHISNNQAAPREWPKFFLKYVLTSTTENLQLQINELILWMDSEIFYEMDPIDQLEYIEYLATDLSPFEKLLFYEAVYFVGPQGKDLGFNVKSKTDWASLYFYGDSHFAHGALYDGGKYIELTFGDDLYYRNKPQIKQVHLYAYMKRLIDVYLAHPEKTIVIPNGQLLKIASEYDVSFYGRTLNFYINKVKGFFPEYVPDEDFDKDLQESYLAELNAGLHLTFTECEKIINSYGLVRSIANEEKEYLASLNEQVNKNRVVSKNAITSRDVISFDENSVRKIWDEKYPVEVSDKIVLDNLGYCTGAVFSRGERLWFRRYGENPYIMEALDKDLSAENADEIFSSDTKVVLMSSSYGSWRGNLELVKDKLIEHGLSKDDIVILDSDQEPSLDGITIYLHPDKTVSIHKKNHSLGVIETIEFSQKLGNLHDPKISSRFDIEDNLIEQLERFTQSITSVSTASIYQRAYIGQSI